MRMQSPSSSGLLPASYSRRRRNRPNDSSNSNNAMYEEIPSAPSTPSNYTPQHYDISNNGGVGGGRTIQNFTSIYSTDLSIPLSTSNNNINNKGGKNSDDENDENDQRNNNNNNNRLDLSSNSDYDSYDDGYEDVLDKPPKLSDFVINDSCYQRYLLEGKRGKYKGLKGSATIDGNNKGIMDPTFLAKVCAISSFIGMLFLIWVAVMMETQPLYIKGVSPKSNYGGGGNGNDDEQPYRFRKETSNALKAAAAYFLTMVLSVIYLQVKDMNLEIINPALMGRLCHLKRLMISTYFRWRRRHYDDIPDNNHSRYSYGGSDVLPMQQRNLDDGTLKSRRTNNNNRRRKKGSEHISLLHSPDRGGISGGGGGGAVGGFLGKLFGKGGSKTKRKKDR